MKRFLCSMAVLLAPALVGADLQSVKAEPHLEKRSKAALENAQLALKNARQAYAAGDLKQTQAALQEVQESVELSYSALQETHKNASKSPKHFKNAEIKTRELLRNLEAFRIEASVEDRSLIEPVKERVQQVHDDILLAIMGGKK